MTNPVVIVGAGPYGLSLAAHLRAAGVRYRLFGQPMGPWKANMPPGMMLKSGIDSSDLFDPSGTYGLGEFYKENGWNFSREMPIAVDRFTAYGLAFQQRFAPDIDTRHVINIAGCGNGSFLITLADGDSVCAERVVIAVGIHSFRYIPPPLADFDSTLVTHSATYGPISALEGKAVAVLGAGASAIDLAVALHEHGIAATVLARRATIEFHQPPQPWLGFRSQLQQLRHPTSPIGSGWRIKFCASSPGLLHRLPAAAKWRMTDTYLGAAPGWFMRDRARGISIFTGQRVVRAEQVSDGICLQHCGADCVPQERVVSHVIAATGYRVDMRRLDFLDAGILASIRTIQSAPILSKYFETSRPGLYMIGPAAAASFGPVMRFVYGAKFTTQRLSRHFSALAGRVARIPPRNAATFQRISS